MKNLSKFLINLDIQWMKMDVIQSMIRFRKDIDRIGSKQCEDCVYRNKCNLILTDNGELPIT